MLATWKFIIVSDEELSPTRTKFCLNERNYKTYKLDDQPKRTRPDFSSFPVQSPAFVRSSYLTILILISRNDLYCVEKLLGWCIFYFFSNKCFFSLLNHIYIYTISKYFPLIIIISYRQVNYSISYFFFFNPVNFKIWRIYMKIYILVITLSLVIHSISINITFAVYN